MEAVRTCRGKKKTVILIPTIREKDLLEITCQLHLSLLKIRL